MESFSYFSGKRIGTRRGGDVSSLFSLFAVQSSRDILTQSKTALSSTASVNYPNPPDTNIRESARTNLLNLLFSGKFKSWKESLFHVMRA